MKCRKCFNVLWQTDAFKYVVNVMINIRLERYNALLPDNWANISWHDDVMKWKYFPGYWPFVRGIHRGPVNSPQKELWRGAFIVLFDLRMNKLLSKQSWGWWFETLSPPLWRHCNGLVWWDICVIQPKSANHKYVNERYGVSNHRHLDCLPNSLFRRRSKKASKLRFIGLFWGEFTDDQRIPRTKGQ